MARGSKMVVNRAAIDEVTLAMADGLFALGKAIVEEASGRAPDSPYDPYPKGEGLPKQGGVLAYVNGKKVAGWSLTGKQPKPPRAARVSKGRGVVVIVGWGFPGRFQEFGTVRHGAQPFFTPAVDATLPRATGIMAPIIGPKLPRP